MEFKFSVNEYFKEPIVEVSQNLLPPGFRGDKRALWDTVSKVSEVVNAMGMASATAQGLTKPITTADRLRNSEHRLYLLIDRQSANGAGAITGMLKTGKKGLYVFDREGQHHQVQPNCILDFYVHESRQRQGLGRKLFDHMLEKEKVEPVQMAIDRPSEKFLAFLNKHYHLANGVRQMNNYVVFDGFFPKSPAATNNNSVAASDAYRSPRQPANGLQQTTLPMGRYGAPRPMCSMGQIIHNDTAVAKSTPDSSGYYARQNPQPSRGRVTLFGERVTSNYNMANEENAYYDYESPRQVNATFLHQSDRSDNDNRSGHAIPAASRPNVPPVLPETLPVSHPYMSSARSDLTIIAPPAQYLRRNPTQEQAAQNIAPTMPSGTTVPQQKIMGEPNLDDMNVSRSNLQQTSIMSEMPSPTKGRDDDAERYYRQEQIPPHQQNVPEPYQENTRYTEAPVYEPQTISSHAMPPQEQLPVPPSQAAPPERLDYQSNEPQSVRPHKQIKRYTLPHQQRYSPEQLCAKCGQNPIVPQDWNEFPAQHPEGQYCTTYNKDFRSESRPDQSLSQSHMAPQQSGDSNVPRPQYNPPRNESSFSNVMLQEAPQYPENPVNNMSQFQAVNKFGNDPLRGPGSRNASQRPSPNQSRLSLSGPGDPVLNSQPQTQDCQGAYNVTPIEPKASTSKGDTQPEEKLLSSSASESVRPTPKLERPRSLSIQLSEDTEKNCAEEKNSNERISECSAEQLDNIENDVENLTVEDNTNDNVELNGAAVEIANEIDEEGKGPSERKNSNLTDQGYVDLKFYHSKLW